MKMVMTLACLTALTFPALAQDISHHADPSGVPALPAVKSLSAKDVEEITRGGGWGLAKAAELNGVPGPAHVLELADELGLTANQRIQVEAIRGDMKRKAVAAGKILIDLEVGLDDGFRSGTMTDGRLKATLAQIADASRELRYIHLAAHLTTPSVLTPEQVKMYGSLRGYKD